MRKLIVGAMVSLDGVMQAPGGPDEDPTGGFTYGGWVRPHFDAGLGEAMGERFARPFDLLLGRKTYDIFAAHWPYVDADDPIGSAFNRAAKHVATRNPQFRPTWQNSHLLGPDAVAGVRALKAGDGPDLLTQGSADFLQTLFAHDLVDELWISVFPVVLGTGKRLFGEGASPGALKLVGSRVSGSGVVTATYVRDGEVRTGSFAAPEPSAAELERRRNLR